MSNAERDDEQLETLQALSEMLREAADRYGGDYAATWDDVRSKIERMPSERRARLDAMLRSILRFEPPPSRVPQ